MKKGRKIVGGKERNFDVQNGFCEAVKLADLSIPQIEVIGNGEEVLRVPDPSLNGGSGGVKEGVFFGKLVKDLVGVMPGSVVKPIDFLGQFGVGLRDAIIPKTELLGGKMGQKPLFEASDKGTYLRVFHGAANEQAVEMAILAKQGFEDKDNRAKYQTCVKEVMEPVLKWESNAEVRIVEDCIASGETVMGLLATMEKAGWDLASKTIRIDVAVATAQGVMVLKEFAKQNKLKLEINTGFMGFGLSAGVVNEKAGTREHANYLVWPESLLDQAPKEARNRLMAEARWNDGAIYVVGDMGDAGKSLPKKDDQICPWNAYRDDLHGDRGMNGRKEVQRIDNSDKVAVLLTNGGYWMLALAKYFKVINDYQTAVMSAKRVWSSDNRFGYGVLLNNVPPGMFEGFLVEA